MLADASPAEVLSLVTGKSPKIRSRAALYCASFSSRVNFDLSLDGVASTGDVTPSSLVVSAPASDVVLEGTEELGAVLAPADALPGPRPPLRIILNAAALLDWAPFADMALEIILSEAGLPKVSWRSFNHGHIPYKFEHTPLKSLTELLSVLV